MLTSTERLVETNGVRLRVIEAGDAARPWWCWPTASPNWRTPGATRSRCWPRPATTCWRPTSAATAARRSPAAVEDYDIVALTGDLVGLLDDVGAERAVFVGHDWGAMVVWNCAAAAPGPGSRRRRAERSAGAAAAGAADASVLAQMFGDNFFYILYFQEPGLADAELSATRPAPCAG